MSINKQFYFPARYHYYYDLEINLSHNKVVTSIHYHGETIGDVLRATYKLREDKPGDMELFKNKFLQAITKLIPDFNPDLLTEEDYRYPSDILVISYPDTLVKKKEIANYIFELGKKIQSEASTEDEYYEYVPNTLEALSHILNHLGEKDKGEVLIELLKAYGHYGKS